MKLIEQCLSKWFVPKDEHTFLKIYLDGYHERYARSEKGKEILQKQLDKEIEVKNVVFSYVKRIALETIFDQVDDEDLRTDRFYALLLNSVKALSDRHKGDVSKIRKIGAIALNRKDFDGCSDPVTAGDVDQIVKAIAELRSQQESSQEISQTYLRLCQNFRRMAERVRGLGELLLDGDISFVDVETDEFYSRLESQVLQIQKSKAITGYRLARVGSNYLGIEIESAPLVSDVEYAQIEKKALDLRQQAAELQSEKADLARALEQSQQEVRDLKSRYTERYAQMAEITVDVEHKLKALNDLNKI